MPCVWAVESSGDMGRRFREMSAHVSAHNSRTHSVTAMIGKLCIPAFSLCIR